MGTQAPVYAEEATPASDGYTLTIVTCCDAVHFDSLYINIVVAVYSRLVLPGHARRRRPRQGDTCGLRKASLAGQRSRRAGASTRPAAAGPSY